MIVWVCNAIREEQVRTEARRGATSPGRAYAQLGCKAKCGSCLPFAREIMGCLCYTIATSSSGIEHSSTCWPPNYLAQADVASIAAHLRRANLDDDVDTWHKSSAIQLLLNIAAFAQREVMMRILMIRQYGHLSSRIDWGCELSCPVRIHSITAQDHLELEPQKH